jgi:hypothetical protein
MASENEVGKKHKKRHLKTASENDIGKRHQKTTSENSIRKQCQ